MVFVIDVDDTLCDTDGYSEYYISKFFAEHNLPYKLVKKESRFAEGKFDWSMETALEWYKKYGDQMMLEFPPKLNAVKIINDLYDAGHKIIFATARANDWHTDPEGITKKWFKINGIKFSKLYIGQADKAKICAEEQADIFIDDDIKLCQTVLDQCKNTTSLLMSTTYNQTQIKPENLKIISDLSELIKYIK